MLTSALSPLSPSPSLPSLPFSLLPSLPLFYGYLNMCVDFKGDCQSILTCHENCSVCKSLHAYASYFPYNSVITAKTFVRL